MSKQSNCPSCGAPITFHVGTSLVAVCEYCKAVVGRGDRGLESLGKVADLVETASPLDVGIKGSFDGVPFDLVGRTQYAHPAGGVWDEWYAAFADGSWGWLAEAQGRFYLTFEETPPAKLPSYEDVHLGQKLPVNEDLTLTVAEKNRGTTASARGEIPYRVVPGEVVPFVDLSGPNGEFGTIDYSDGEATLYLGRQVTLDELHIPPQARRRYPGQEPTIQAVALNCPQCGGAFELRAPDRSERVGCPNCGALSDVKEGRLALLRSLEPPPVQPVLPLGATGQRDGVTWTVIGFLRRFVTIEGTDYFWEEYLLYQPRLGFRWLTRSDDHWNWVEAVPPAAVTIDGNTAMYADRWYRLFQKAAAKVAFVVGEFYWKVEAGELVQSRDYVNAPAMLSREDTVNDGEGEVNVSYATYLEPGDVQQMFGLTTPLPRPATIGPNQPFRYTGVYWTALWLLAAALALGVGLRFLYPGHEVYDRTTELPAVPAEKRAHQVVGEEPIELRGLQNIRVLLKPRVDAGWVHIDGELVAYQPPPVPGSPTPASSGTRRPFAFLAEGGQTAYVYLSAVPAGKYTLRYDLAARNPAVATAAEVRIDQGLAHPFPLVVAVLVLGAVPVCVGLYQLWFQSRRWADSNV